MTFQPSEIAEKDFLVTVRGYDRNEVRAFLRAIATQYHSMLELLQERASVQTGYSPEPALALKKAAEDEMSDLRRARGDLLGLIAELAREVRSELARVLAQEKPLSASAGGG